MGRRGKLVGWTVLVVAIGLVGALACKPETPIRDVQSCEACGAVDIEPHARPDPLLERLVLQEQYIDAIAHTVTLLRESCDRLGPLDPETLDVLHRLGVVSLAEGDSRTAMILFDAVLEARKHVLGPDHLALVETLLRRGQLTRYRGDLETSRRDYDRAAAILASNPGHPLLEAHLEHVRADWTWRRGDRTRALEMYRHALDMRRQATRSTSFAVADNLVWLGWHLGRNGQTEASQRTYLEAREALRALGLTRHTLNGTIDHDLADAFAVVGRWSEAEPLYRSTARVFEQARGGYPPGYSRRSCPPDGFDGWAVAALHAGRAEEAWRLVERSRAPLHAEFASIGAWKHREPISFGELKALRRGLLEARRRVAAARAAGTETWSAETFTTLLRMLEHVRDVYRMEAGYLQRNPPEEPSIERMRELLDEGTALIGWTEMILDQRTNPCIDERWLYVLRKRGPVVWLPLAPENASFHESWEAVLRASGWPLRVPEDTEAIERLQAWTAGSFDAARPHLTGADRIVVSGMMRPVHILVGPHGFVGDEFQIFQIPSVAVAASFVNGARTKHGSGEHSILAVAGPTSDTGPRPIAPSELVASVTDDRGGRGLRSAILRQDLGAGGARPLRFAGSEAGLAARWFPRATVLSRIPDVVPRIQRMAEDDELARFDVIHVAAHTVLDSDPESCAMLLGAHGPSPEGNDGLLEVDEVLYGWDLDADLLVLSGCHSARSMMASRHEHSGFSPALLAVGARNLITSLWPVDDRATTVLMDRFYGDLTGNLRDPRTGKLASPMDPGAALQEARRYMRELTAADGSRPFEHPAYWGGFIVLGMPAPRDLRAQRRLN